MNCQGCTKILFSWNHEWKVCLKGFPSNICLICRAFQNLKLVEGSVWNCESADIFANTSWQGVKKCNDASRAFKEMSRNKQTTWQDTMTGKKVKKDNVAEGDERSQCFFKVNIFNSRSTLHDCWLIVRVYRPPSPLFAQYVRQSHRVQQNTLDTNAKASIKKKKYMLISISHTPFNFIKCSRHTKTSCKRLGLYKMKSSARGKYLFWSER